MTIKVSGVLAGVVALLAATSASASIMTDQGHYAWRPGVQAPGPRAPIAAPRRVWVPSGTMAANGDALGMPCCKNHRL